MTRLPKYRCTTEGHRDDGTGTCVDCGGPSGKPVHEDVTPETCPHCEGALPAEWFNRADLLSALFEIVAIDATLNMQEKVAEHTDYNKVIGIAVMAIMANAMTKEMAEKLRKGQLVRVLVDGRGDVEGEEKTFAAGEIVTVCQTDTFSNDQGFAVTVCAANGVVNVFDELDYGKLYPFQIV